MATYLHFAPALALAVAIGPQRIGWRLTLAGAACAVLPDADFLLYVLHIDAYGGTYGHRGFTHSLLAVAAMGGGCTLSGGSTRIDGMVMANVVHIRGNLHRLAYRDTGACAAPAPVRISC